MTGGYDSQGEHESALLAAEREGYIAIRIIKAPYPSWQRLLVHLMGTGDAEGTCWDVNTELNDKLRVVGPARNELTCWFSVFITKQVYDGIKFIDGVYDLSKIAGGGEPELQHCVAIRDMIFMRRGVDHGALVEIAADTTKHTLGYHAIEGDSQVDMWRLTQRIALCAEQYFDVQQGTRIAIRTRYRPQKLTMIHTLMVASKAHSMGMEWKVMNRLRQLNGKPADLVVADRRFRLTDFERAETAYAPLNSQRLQKLKDSDLQSQGRRCTVDNLPTDCDQDRLLNMLNLRGLQLSSRPVLIDSKFRFGTRVAFVTFATEEMALNAIMEAPFMSMSGMHPMIKPTQPKANRPLSAVEADERKRMETLGPTDGMTKEQIASVVEKVDTASGAQLDFLREQFKIDETGSFANTLVNTFKAEFRMLRSDFKDLRSEVRQSVDGLSAVVKSTVEAQQDFQNELVDTLQSIHSEQRDSLGMVNTTLLTMGTNLSARELQQQAVIEDINTRLEALDFALKMMAMPAQQKGHYSGPSHTPNAHSAAQDSDDSEHEEGSGDGPQVEAPETPEASDSTVIPTGLLSPNTDLGDGMTAAHCAQLVHRWNSSAGLDQQLPTGPNSDQLHTSALQAMARLQAASLQGEPHEPGQLPQEDPPLSGDAQASLSQDYLSQSPTLELAPGFTVQLCGELIGAWNSIAEPHAKLHNGRTTAELLDQAQRAKLSLISICHAETKENTKGYSQAKAREALGSVLPEALTSTERVVVQPSSEALALGLPQVPMPEAGARRRDGDIREMLKKQAQGKKRDAVSPANVTSPSMELELQQQGDGRNARGDSAPFSPPRVRQKPEMATEQAMEYIFRLTSTHPDNEAYQTLTSGRPETLIARGVRARDILESLTPHNSPYSYDSTWQPDGRLPTEGMTRGPRTAQLKETLASNQ